jgi:nucleoid-associated protein YgaU
VRPGDSLSKISKDVYGDPNQYMRIFNANRDKLQDPDKIQAGQQLLIPKP